MYKTLIFAFGLILTQHASAEDELKGIRPSYGSDIKIVPIDIETIDINYIFDVENKKATGEAEILFNNLRDGYPSFDLEREIISAEFESEDVTALIVEEQDPDAASKHLVFRKVMKKGTQSTLRIKFDLSPKVSFTKEAARVGFFMTDLRIGGRGFVEQYAPANFEFDQLKYNFTLKVIGTDKEHLVFANGATTSTGFNQFAIDYPSYFTTSSLYFHISEKGRFKIERETFKGLERQIPVVTYADKRTTAKEAMRKALAYMEELENDYGPYTHDAMTIYIAGRGGMEHCGATISSMSALGHEITHSWFARGVMPANGNAGWIDEGTARWRDRGYPVAKGFVTRKPVNLSNYSPFQRHTPRISYAEGSKLLSELDYMFRDLGSMKLILREFYRQYKRKTVVIEDFQRVIEEESGIDMDDIFTRYVYGQDKGGYDIDQESSSFTKAATKYDDDMPMQIEEYSRYQ